MRKVGFHNDQLEMTSYQLPVSGDWSLVIIHWSLVIGGNAVDRCSRIVIGRFGVVMVGLMIALSPGRSSGLGEHAQELIGLILQ